MIEMVPVGSEPRAYSVRKSPWRDATGRILGVVSVNRDVTEQCEAEARLRATQADLLRATRLSSMGAMASGLAHELNQPLSAATNYLNAAERMLSNACTPGECKAGAVRTGATLADARTQVKRAAEIVRRLSAFVGRGEAELTFEDVGDLLREVEQLAEAGGILAGVPLSVSRGPPGLQVLADRIQIQQVLLNLVRNAAEALAGADGPGAPRITLAVAPRAGGGAEIVVADNGPGLTADVRQRLFEPFVSTKPDGMGIGLAICRTIIEGHGGSIAADPGIGGATFRIFLPSPRPTGGKP
jgi:two-component system sensor kinase FixL